jgi:hypothetical protein
MESISPKPSNDPLYGALGALTGMTVIPKKSADQYCSLLSLDKYAAFSFSFSSIYLSDSIKKSKDSPGNEELFVIHEGSKKLVIEYVATDTIKKVKKKIINKIDYQVNHFNLLYRGQRLGDEGTLADFGVKPSDHILLVLVSFIKGSGPSILAVPDDMFDRSYDYDFTKIDDRRQSFKRGGLPYYRPCGCKRYALKVLGKYDGGKNIWLGCSNSPGEWAVSYHGTSNKNAEPIVKWGLKVGVRNAYGCGIYCTPNPRTALEYSEPYTASDIGKKYKIVFQNRVRVEAIHRASDKGGPDDYWYIPDTSDIRPYGICIYEKC